MSCRYVALMRGINVGGKNKLPMKELAALFSDAGCENVRTYIQSGNVLFDLPEPDRDARKVTSTLAASVSESIARDFGFRIPIVMRSEAEMRAALADNPFFDRGDPAERLFVMFLADSPGADRIEALDPLRSAPDEFEVRGQEIFLSIASSAATTRLTNAYFDSKLATISTSRNWRTATKLLELLSE